MKNEEVSVRKGNTTMMGTKARNVAPLIDISLEDLVPQDHLYRHLEQTLDLSFARHPSRRMLQSPHSPHALPRKGNEV